MRKIIEDKAAGISLIQDLKDAVPGVIPYNPKAKSKAERAKLVSPLVESRNVYLPLHRAWTRDFVDECISFDGSGKTHDDMLDAMSQALIKMKRTSQKFYIGSL
jgi:predicted phage terminase large subunit-like protein